MVRSPAAASASTSGTDHHTTRPTASTVSPPNTGHNSTGGTPSTAAYVARNGSAITPEENTTGPAWPRALSRTGSTL